ncbi:MAG TPA: DUF169 domain-containing protein [Myxococcales bacterium]|jgi:uncharacterized protein (DUF169 family)
MDSPIAKALGLKHRPVAVVWTDEAPEEAIRFEKGRWGCVMASFAAAAERGLTAAFDRETYGCQGGGVGLGFGNCYEAFLGGVEGFRGFLSNGNESSEAGRARCATAEKLLRGSQLDHFKHGERYRKSPEAVARFIAALPIREVPTKYVLFKPLDEVKEGERAVGVVFLANPNQLSALTILANYEDGDCENVIMPHAAGCQSIGIYLYREAENPRGQRAVAGLNDLSARKTVRRLGKDLMTFAVPMERWAQMERNLPGSFVERDSWKDLQG